MKLQLCQVKTTTAHGNNGLKALYVLTNLHELKDAFIAWCFPPICSRFSITGTESIPIKVNRQRSKPNLNILDTFGTTTESPTAPNIRR